MEVVRLFKSLDRNQRNTFVACFLGWALDAFDFFLLTFVIAPMARRLRHEHRRIDLRDHAHAGDAPGRRVHLWIAWATGSDGASR